ncbi:hypothetical protein [Prosthecobacter sp.]|uniref:hypothetical protein n=1 Tax=Prosthecobacter sp. TaxID=1965333 RepID=UPI002ABC2B34|nr:hypothetical protein [Prosthecobacter sp.]MDZ4401124.1 hypothetical protein [Prosthecobacter sp.]
MELGSASIDADHISNPLNFIILCNLITPHSKPPSQAGKQVENDGNSFQSGWRGGYRAGFAVSLYIHTFPIPTRIIQPLPGMPTSLSFSTLEGHFRLESEGFASL